MPKPTTPLVGCETFVLNKKGKVLLIKRAASGTWGMPGGFHDLGETPLKCAIRECFEETGYKIKIIRLLGVFSSKKYKYVYYKWKKNEIVHVFFQGKIVGGSPKTSEESTEVAWFDKNKLPKLFDGHAKRIRIALAMQKNKKSRAYFE